MGRSSPERAARPAPCEALAPTALKHGHAPGQTMRTHMNSFHPALLLLTALALGSTQPARAGLPDCSHPDVAERARFHFDDAQESRTPPGPRRSRGLEAVRETGRAANSSPLAPAGYETRHCEGDLRLDDNSTLHLFIMVVGKAGDAKPTFEGLETCWADPRFPRASEGCKTEKAPGRR